MKSAKPYWSQNEFSIKHRFALSTPLDKSPKVRIVFGWLFANSLWKRNSILTFAKTGDQENTQYVTIVTFRAISRIPEMRKCKMELRLQEESAENLLLKSIWHYKNQCFVKSAKPYLSQNIFHSNTVLHFPRHSIKQTNGEQLWVTFRWFFLKT